MKSTLLAVIVAAGVTLIAQDPVVRPDAPLIDVPPRTTLSDTDRDRLIKRLIDRLTRQYSGLPATTPEPKPEDVEDQTQDQQSVLDDLAGSETLVISSNAPAPQSPHRATASLWRLFSPPFVVVEANQPTQGGLQFLFTSLGVSTGEAFDVRIINHTGKPVTLDPGGLVLRPLKRGAGERAAREFEKQGAKAVRVRMSGYCLQFRKDAPKAGTIFVAAPAPMQQQFAAAPIIFRAAAALREHNLLKPTGNPTAYFHSIRQWVWWTQEQKFTQETFTTALLEYTKKNMQNAKQPWSKEAEAYVRATAPNRWADIANTLWLAQQIEQRARP